MSDDVFPTFDTSPGDHAAFVESPEYERGLTTPAAGPPPGEPFNVPADMTVTPRAEPYDRPTIPIIGTVPYPGRVIDARTIVFAAGAVETIGYRGGAPSPGISIVVYAVGAGVVDVMPSTPSGAATSMRGAQVPTVPLALAVDRLTLRAVDAGATAVVLIVANTREP